MTYVYEERNGRYGIMEAHAEAPDAVVDTRAEAVFLCDRLNGVDKEPQTPNKDSLEAILKHIGESPSDDKEDPWKALYDFLENNSIGNYSVGMLDITDLFNKKDDE